MNRFDDYQIILASKSPRRRELLTREQIPFTVLGAEGEECYHSTVPSEIVMELSRQKADEVYHRVMQDTGFFEKDTRPLVIIGADTIVTIDGKILGKPKDEDDACRMLRLLQGRAHHVVTGCTLILKRPGRYLRRKIFFEDTAVIFHPMTDEEITSYVATKEPMDKAGSYAIQGIGGKYVKEIAGDYDNVVGLPVGRLEKELQMFLLGTMT